MRKEPKTEEIYSLVEYCKIFDYDISDFIFSEKPDIQSVSLDIGIECTSTIPEEEYIALSKCLPLEKDKKRTEKRKDLEEKRDEAFEKMNTASGKYLLDLINRHENLSKSIDALNPAVCYFPASVTDTDMLIDCVRQKTEKKLNNHNPNERYTIYGTNALFIRVASLFAGSNHFHMCGIDNCIVSQCAKRDDYDICTDCEKSDKRIVSSDDGNIALQWIDTNDCKYDCNRRICPVGKSVKKLIDTSFKGEHKFNEIILSQTGADRDDYCCWVINADEYTITEHRGKRRLTNEEFLMIENLIKQKIH